MKLRFLLLLSSFFITYFLSSEIAHARQGRGRLWLGISTQKNFYQNEKWLWAFNSQIRFTKQKHPLNSVFTEPLIGYQFLENSFWFGYRFTQHIYNRPSFKDNRFVQQLVYPINENMINWNHRFRLEEGYRSNRKQMYLRLRQRLSMELTLSCDSNNKPYIYNELFFMLNKTNYTSHRFISENRLFLGFNVYSRKDTWWEIGYMLQYLAKRPRNNMYQINHILSINYNFR